MRFSRFRPLVAVFAVLIVATAPAVATAGDEWTTVVGQIVEQLPERDEPFRVAVLPFPCGMRGYDGISTLSMIIEDHIRAAVSREQSLELITRDAIQKLQAEGAFQTHDIVDPDSWTKVNVKGVHAVIGGRWTYMPGVLNVSCRLVVTDGGREYAAMMELPYTLPANTVDGEIFPPTGDSQKANTEKLKTVQRRIPGNDIGVKLWVEGGKTHFREGDYIQYGVRTDRDCHLALVCHEVTGNTIALFPNAYSKSTLMRAGVPINIPGEGDKGGFRLRIQAPFGTDIVQVIACTSRSELTRLVKDIPRYQRTRSFGIEFAPQDEETDRTEPGPTKWGSTYIMVRTVPAPTAATRGL